MLPSKLHAEGIVVNQSERSAAVEAVLRAEEMVRRSERLAASAPVIVLGANGFVGERLISRLAGRNIYAIDVGPAGVDSANRQSWPAQLSGQRALLINVARSETLAAYLDLLWGSLVILNEVYPEPKPHILEKLAAMNCRCYHLAGAVGTAYPSFPWPYVGAIPCCAAQIDRETALIIRRLA